MRAYSVTGPNATGTGPKTLATIIAATTVRPRLFDLIVGNAQTPVDQGLQMTLGRFTAVGTAGSNPTPLPVDPADVAAVATAGITHSAEPTYTAGGSLLDFGMNQRSVFRWVAVPGYELLAPATANNGLGLCMTLASTSAVIQRGTLHWFE